MLATSKKFTIKNVINDIFIKMEKKIIRLTEGELTNLIKKILKEDSTTNNCVKEKGQ